MVPRNKQDHTVPTHPNAGVRLLSPITHQHARRLALTLHALCARMTPSASDTHVFSTTIDAYYQALCAGHDTFWCDPQRFCTYDEDGMPVPGAISYVLWQRLLDCRCDAVWYTPWHGKSSSNATKRRWILGHLSIPSTQGSPIPEYTAFTTYPNTTKDENGVEQPVEPSLGARTRRSGTNDAVQGRIDMASHAWPEVQKHEDWIAALFMKTLAKTRTFYVATTAHDRLREEANIREEKG